MRHASSPLSLYADANASMPLRPEALLAMTETLQQTGNPASLHTHGQKSRAILEESREMLAHLLKLPSAHFFFTSGGTESNFLALWGVAPHVHTILVSAIEHPSVLLNAENAAKTFGCALVFVPVTADGVLDLNALEKTLKNA